MQQEAERQYKMREAQWLREENARINLLKDVYNSREKDILLKQAMKKEMEWLVKDIHEELKSWGHPGGQGNRLILRSDGENPIVALREAVAKNVRVAYKHATSYTRTLAAHVHDAQP